tara:strand:- start:241 stop:552 length:312 start_codon:yes stop_codon:yes gene_type:complete
MNNQIDGYDPFEELTKIFIDNQRNFTSKTNDLIDRTKNLKEKLDLVLKQLSQNCFKTNLNLYLNLEEEAKLIVMVAKEVEFQRDNILKSVEVLKQSKEIKLNK